VSKYGTFFDTSRPEVDPNDISAEYVDF
jgi:hypothetical protein